jgi:hypothetical protein
MLRACGVGHGVFVIFGRLADWLALKDAVTMTGKGDPQYAERAKEAKAARAKLKAQEARVNEHVASHECW